MFLIDSHCHLDKLNYNHTHKNFNDVLKKAKKNDVKFILSVCTNLKNYFLLKKNFQNIKNVAYSCGIHPLYQDTKYDYNELLKLCSDKYVIAIGETGLDYFHTEKTKIQQKISFRQHIYIAKKLNKPIIVHTRCSRKDTLSILIEEKVDTCGGMIHSFSEDLATAKKILDMNFYISFSGILTFKNAELVRKAARFIPIDRILLETDSPYLTPEPYRNQENQPAFVKNIAIYLAKLKKIDVEFLANKTTENFFSLFKIQKNNL